jgi:hypothetical protein
LRASLFIVAAACAGSASQEPEALAGPPCVVDATSVTVHAQLEAPAGSRLQAAYAAVDAQARAALLELVAVNVTSLFEDRATEQKTDVRERIVASVRGAVEGSTLVEHAHREEGGVLRVYGRLRVSRDVLDRAVAGAGERPEKAALLAARMGGAPKVAQAPGAGPRWADAGSGRTPAGHRFVCTGEGSSEADALTTARGVCDDQICKLCGVEIESRVVTEETLQGIGVQRRVVERCRRIRRGELELARKSVDCGPEGCVAWIQVDYPDTLRDQECRRGDDAAFADPARCTQLIDELAATTGSSAASFRQRVASMEQAIVACAEIDVRPTPMMESLDAKLRIAMRVFRDGAPRNLRDYWLAEHAPLWEAYRLSPRFAERLQLLLGYLRSRAPILDVLEVASLDDDGLDRPEAMARLLAALRAAPLDDAYGTPGVHMTALGRFGNLRLSTDVSAIGEWARDTFAPEKMGDWGDVVAMYALFRADGAVDAAEWSWATRLGSWRSRCLEELLRAKEHRGGTRVERFVEAVALAGGEPRKALEAAVPNDAPNLFLDAAPRLPEPVRAAADFRFLWKMRPSADAWWPDAERRRFFDAAADALKRAPPDRELCLGLYEVLDSLEAEGSDVRPLGDLVCRCLTGPLADTPTHGSGNKHPLYERALAQELACVRP